MTTVIEVQEFISQNLEQWIDDIVVGQIRLMASTRNLPLDYKNSIRIEKKGDFEYEVILDYQKNGVPVGIFFEKGTRGHIIRARIAEALRWLDAHTGKPRFAKWVRHPGTQGYHVMEESEKIALPLLAEKISSEAQKFVDSRRIP